MKAAVVAVCDPGARFGLGPTAARVDALLPGAAVVQCTEELPVAPRADVVIVVVDPHRALAEAVGRADIVVVDDALASTREEVAAAVAAIRAANERAVVIRASSAPRVGPGASLMNTAVLVVEDGATVVDGGVGPGTLAAVDAEVGMRVDPRPFAVGSLVETYLRHPELGAVLPVMAYDDVALAEVQATIDAVDCDAVVDGTGIDLASRISTRRPVRRVVHELHEVTAPTLAEALGAGT